MMEVNGRFKGVLAAEQNKRSRSGEKDPGLIFTCVANSERSASYLLYSFHMGRLVVLRDTLV